MNQNKNLANKTILLVEDDPINLRVFTKILFLRLAHLYQPGKGKGLPSGLSEKLADLYKQTEKPEPILDILHTEDAEEVIQLSQSGEVDLILMDYCRDSFYRGEAVTGLHITQMLKSNPQTAHLPIIYIGGNGLESCREYLLRSGVDADVYIEKPIVDHQQFADIFQELLSKQNKKNA